MILDTLIFCILYVDVYDVIRNEAVGEHTAVETLRTITKLISLSYIRVFCHYRIKKAILLWVRKMHVRVGLG